MSESIRVIVVDDQAIVREGLVTVLSLLSDIVVLGEAANGALAVELVERLRPDVVLMDLRMPVLDGLAATKQIVAQHPEVAILILTTFADEVSVIDALRAGARGYLTKDAGRAEVAAAVRAVAQGHTTLAAEIGGRLFAVPVAERVEAAVPSTLRDDRDATSSGKASSGSGPSSGTESLVARFNLTPREGEVLDLIGQGFSNTEIAAKLFVGVATVKTHINAIFAKLGVRDRAQAIALTHAHGAGR